MSIVFLLTSFLFIFLSAAPGRTTFVLIMLASKGHLKDIFWGAAAAFFIQCFISVLLGNVLMLLPQSVVELCAGIMFLYFSFSFWKESNHSLEIQSSTKKISIKSVFTIVFLAEFGDVSQLAIAATASKSPSKMAIFIIAVIAMWIITGLSLCLGHNLKRISKTGFIQKMAAIFFFLIGLFLIFSKKN